MPAENLTERSATIYARRTSLTTTAAPLGSSTEDLTELVLQADPDNTVSILIGSSDVQCWVLEPSDQFAVPIRNPALIWGKAASGTATCNLIGRKGA